MNRLKYSTRVNLIISKEKNKNAVKAYRGTETKMQQESISIFARRKKINLIEIETQGI